MKEFLIKKEQQAIAILITLALAILGYASTQIEYIPQDKLPEPTPSFTIPEK